MKIYPFVPLLLCAPVVALAQGQGISTQAVTGGLVIPSAQVLDSGTIALTAGTYAEPQLGHFSRRRSYSLGIGLLPNVELFGRIADLQIGSPDTAFNNGIRDLSANVKVQLPQLWRTAPKIALGINDVGGGAAYFKSIYAVASDELGPFKWTAGYARGRPIPGAASNAYAFKGVFGGAELMLGNTGASALAEYDGQQTHAGLRYYSPVLASLGNTQLVGTLQRSFGATEASGQRANASSLSVSLLVPLGKNAARAETFQPDNVLPPVDPKGAGTGMNPTADDLLDRLQRALQAAGLERVRVGTLANNLLVEYENHRYGQNEADAIGIVLGLAVEHAPAGIQRVDAVTHQAGLRLYVTSVGVAEYRNFLRNGDAGFSRGSLAVDLHPSYQAADVKWITDAPTGHSFARVEVKPDLNYTVATDVGTFDYSVAANVQGIVPLWRGAELYTSYVHRLANSENFGPDAVFSSSRQRNGLKVAAIHQSLWLGPHILANVGAGRYNYNALGLQGESTVFVPGRDDVLRLKAGLYERKPGQSRSQAMPVSGSYRWVPSATTWVEAGLQRYSDGSRGPSVVLTRWFGDVAANLFYRKGGSRQFAGLELSIPLTPRRGMEPGPVTFAGTSGFTAGVRTRIASGSTVQNSVGPASVRDFALDYDMEQRQLNRGRISEKYLLSQIYRMREAFFLYGRDLLPK